MSRRHMAKSTAGALTVSRPLGVLVLGVDVSTACGPDRPLGRGQPLPDQWRYPADDPDTEASARALAGLAEALS